MGCKAHGNSWSGKIARRYFVTFRAEFCGKVGYGKEFSVTQNKLWALKN